MQTDIGPYDPDTRTVPVTFTLGDLVHKRGVNACLKDGAYDQSATADRVAQVARGVAVKIELGVITDQPEPDPVPPPAGEAQDVARRATPVPPAPGRAPSPACVRRGSPPGPAERPSRSSS